MQSEVSSSTGVTSESYIVFFVYSSANIGDKQIKNLQFHLYPDDTQLYVQFSRNASCTLETLKECIDDVQKWMSSSKLKLNPNKNQIYSIWLQVLWFLFVMS